MSWTDSAHQLFGVTLSVEQRGQFALYEQLLLEWNERLNLTALRSAEAIRQDHFLDSLSCFLVIEAGTPGWLVDVGAGAGFPGLALKIASPVLDVTLVESVAKKARFLELIVHELELPGVTVESERAELVAHRDEHRAAYDWATARAVASLPVVMEYLVPFLKIGGRMIAMKGPTVVDELEAGRQAGLQLGADRLELLQTGDSSEGQGRLLVTARKLRATDDRYPRRVGIPSKRPLQD